MIDVFILDTEERIKAFTHPYRMRLVHVFRETRRPMTATEVARIIGDGPGRVHYHMRILEAAGIVAVVRTESVNGIIARYYEPTARHYSVADAARGAVGGEPVRDEVARMISRRFRDGLRAFLDRTIGDSEDAADEHAGARGDEAFLFEHVIHCNDQEWLAFRESIEELAARHAEATAGSRPRRVFVAGATDRPAGWSSPLSKAPRQPDRDWPPHPQPER
ncbi:MAG TPA: helix-turn-helix domain-containing protein [bacterium]|nr:helix-turn-helix domain-containing protein [bacterium]